MVAVNLSKVINESVDTGMKKAGLVNTTKNRIETLNGMHKKLVDEEPNTHAIRPILIAIEDEMIALTEAM